MLVSLQKIDSDLLVMPSGDDAVAVSNRLQGRIFCELDGELVHRFNAELAANPSPDNFNNIGGNSLWPGPEGGAFAFNYLPHTEWLVQPAINIQRTETHLTQPAKTVVGKTITLRNRQDATVELEFSRTVLPLDIGRITEKYGLQGVAYRTLDELQAVEGCDLAQTLFCAWSLEQFPGGENVIAFGRCGKNAAGAVNTDFYGNPGERLQHYGQCFQLGLGGKDRFQIGVNHEFQPELIGAYDRQRSLLIIRRTWAQDGLYFNIADNDQPRGPYSAADGYSIFNGGDLGFFELETIAPLQLNVHGRGVNSLLWSETMIFKGESQELHACLKQYFQVHIEG